MPDGTSGDFHTYFIDVRGYASEGDMNANSLFLLAFESIVNGCTRISVQTDQSGLMGLLRYLHGMGFTLLAVTIAANSETQT